MSRLNEVIERAKDLAPVTMVVPLNGPLAVALYRYAMEQGVKAETIIAEAVRAYLGERH